MRSSWKVLLGVVLVAAMLFAVTGCGTDDQSVTLGYVEWDSEIASTNVVATVLEDLGYDVELMSLSPAVMYTSLGEGDYDGMVAAWLPTTHGDYFAEIEDSVVDLGANLVGTRIGLVVPEYVDIDSIEELNENADMFDGQIVGIEPGAGLQQATEVVVEEYGLDNIELLQGSGATMAASLAEAVEHNEPIVVTGWTPHWKFARWDLKYLEDPLNIYGGDEYVHTLVRQNLEEDMPEVYSVLDNFNWTPDDMSEVMVLIEDGMNPAEAARQWVDENQDKVSEWTQ
ncbi:glycine betaine ABC transporter substrate-binding protein [Dethiobacter alkaliphilus]|uniref:Substrate-binding region of ABC-type glycine betaine transport system n=1 Tax=Dethiobacter alkaliphilus AHT 1 TaxID=555088 RepID=C0GIR9_DETAL|nr:glycine betaine ABC transporter substrate-binding protein [Dethiobacter alkaliphilus]EEG76733.1 Substrate-binding region of ABC-type glycine betaine transport system [Dethiobacter alkaliphilus AHT 1]